MHIRAECSEQEVATAAFTPVPSILCSPGTAERGDPCTRERLLYPVQILANSASEPAGTQKQPPSQTTEPTPVSQSTTKPVPDQYETQ